MKAIAILAILTGAGLLVGNTMHIPATDSPANSNPTVKEDKTKMLTWDTLKPEEKSPKRDDKVVLTDEEWKKKLTPEQYNILRSHGTDPRFCGILENTKDKGIYHCAGCDLKLFQSADKFDSGTGWPSFILPVDRKNVWFRTDKSYNMVRVEVLCARCDGHLGHVFPDGPQPSGLRFCINGNAMKFVKEKS